MVLSATGGGADGFAPTFNATIGSDGRHFITAKYPLISKRTTLYLNGIPLNGIEQTISTSPFDSQYDYRMEPLTGRIELQRAGLVDQGGELVIPSASNVGNGTLTVSLLDIDAPTETWTIRAISVIRDSNGNPIKGTATFTAVGSVSGQILDTYGAPITFADNATAKDNTIIQLTITPGTTAFDRGDRFTAKVSSRVLVKGDQLTATYIAEADLNDPEFFQDPQALFAKHGYPSTDNTLALGASMAFENGAFGVLAVGAMPPIPRRTAETLVAVDDPLTTTVEGFPALVSPLSITLGDQYAFEWPLVGGTPDSNSEVHWFVTDATTQKETQIFPTKVPFYDTTITNSPYVEFINGSHTYSYTAIEAPAVDQQGSDGQVTASGFYAGITASGDYFKAASATFSKYNVVAADGDTYKQIKILPVDAFGNTVVAGIAGTYNISDVGERMGDATIVALGSVVVGSGGTLPFAHTVSNLLWELVDPNNTAPELLFTKDLFVNGAIKRGDGLRVTFIDQKDADYYDSNWEQALASLQSQNCQMIVPLPNAMISAVQQATIAHCEDMSNTLNQKERIALIGAINGLTPAAATGQELVAIEDVGILEGIQGNTPEDILTGNTEDLQNYDISTNFGETFRAVYFYPDQIIRVINGSATTIDGFYLAAAAGGYLAGQPNYAIPLTRKILTGFTIPRSRTFSTLTLNQLGNVGACTVAPVVGGGVVVHGKTTVNSGAPEEEEISIVFIRDRVAQALRDTMRGFIGQPQDSTTGAGMTSVATKTIQSLVSQGLLSDFANLSVAQDDIDPRQYNVTVDVQPSYPVCWVYISVGIGQI
jgi:hypothetical protein